MILESKLVSVLENEFNDKRWQHSLGVADTAEKLARQEGISVKKSRLAGLLHDYAKGMAQDKLKKLAKQSTWDIDQLELSISKILHAPVGAYLIYKRFDIADKEILKAVRYHTIGHPQMGDLAQIIFVADIIEPGRDFPGVDQIRQQVKSNLKQGLITVCNHSLKYNIDHNRLLHPNTLLLRNSLLEGD